MSKTPQRTADFLTALGFAAETGGVFCKRYENGYAVFADPAGDSIDYGGRILREDATTSNFSAPENFVVLECVNRLLEKGYRPEDLTLEKKWKLGRTGKSGKSDIVVRARNSEKILLIIECKTWGGEYEKEKKRMQQDGGQLFSYFQQDKSAGFLALYTSRIGEDGKPEFLNAVVPVWDSPEERRKQAEEPDEFLTYEKAAAVRQSVMVWEAKNKKSFLPAGIFEEDREPYSPGFIPLRIGKLEEFSRENKVYDQFMEILRHNNISDRSNAFNRFLSLVLAKMKDESSKEENEVAEFQYKPGVDDAESLYERLQGLYTAAMKDYLKEELVNHTLDSVREIVEHFPRQTAQDDLYRIYRELKLYSNNEFAFKEVYNEKLFYENSKVLEEVVSVLQPYQFRYKEKSRFLGEFFELMLENGYKQTEGQFFTPTPLARFIISAMPLDRLVARKLRRRSGGVLPRIVDFACGSGHFLTESIEALQNIMNRPKFSGNPKLEKYAGNTDWARDYIWGVERDYRLARTSQVACFMHGDGEANIVFGDGLEKHPAHNLREGVFDVLAANPPYSIDGFKVHLNAAPKDFELWDDVGENSDDIEVFFIERAGQLLANGGMAGIILPSTILDKPGLYGKAREILMRRFLIRAVVSLGGRAFAATGTQTIVLFLEKRPDDFAQNCRFIADDLILGNEDRDEDHVNSRELYADFLRHRGINSDTNTAYWEALNREKPDLVKYYRQKFRPVGNKNTEKHFARFVLSEEAERFYYFLLTYYSTGKKRNQNWYKQKTLIIRNNGGTDSQSRFLGYKFSKRRGGEGLQQLGEGLLCDKNAEATDSGKVNYYIYRAFEGEYPPLSGEVKEYCHTAHLCDLIDFNGEDFTGGININANVDTTPEIKSRWKTALLGQHIQFSPKSKRPASQGKERGRYPFFTSSPVQSKFIDAADHHVRSVIIGDGGKSGVHIASKFSASDHNFVITANASLDLDYLYYWLSGNFHVLASGLKGANLQNIPKSHVQNIKLPLPPLAIQKGIAAECAAVDKNAESARQTIIKINADIAQLLGNNKKIKLSEVVSLSPEKMEPSESPDEYFHYIGLEHIESGTGMLVEKTHIPGGELKSAKHVFSEGDILYGKLRPYLNKVYAAEFGGICSTDILVLKTDMPLFIKYILLGKSVLEQTARHTKGTNLPRIGVQDFLNLQIAAPSLTQTAHEKLEKADARITELRAQIESAAARKAEILEKHL